MLVFRIVIVLKGATIRQQDVLECPILPNNFNYKNRTFYLFQQKPRNCTNLSNSSWCVGVQPTLSDRPTRTGPVFNLEYAISQASRFSNQIPSFIVKVLPSGSQSIKSLLRHALAFLPTIDSSPKPVL